MLNMLSIKNISTFFCSRDHTILKQVIPSNHCLGFPRPQKEHLYFQNLNKQKKGKLHPCISQKEPPPQPFQLQEKCLPYHCPFHPRVWLSHLQPLSQKGHLGGIEIIERSAAKFITWNYGSNAPSSVEKLLSRLSLPTLQERHLRLCLVLLYERSIWWTLTQLMQ